MTVTSLDDWLSAAQSALDILRRDGRLPAGSARPEADAADAWQAALGLAATAPAAATPEVWRPWIDKRWVQSLPPLGTETLNAAAAVALLTGQWMNSELPGSGWVIGRYDAEAGVPVWRSQRGGESDLVRITVAALLDHLAGREGLSPIDYAQRHIENADRPIGWFNEECRLVTVTARAPTKRWGLRAAQLPLQAGDLPGRSTQHQSALPGAPQPGTVEWRTTHVLSDIYWWTEDYVLDREPATSVTLRIHGGHDRRLAAAASDWRATLVAFEQLAERLGAQLTWESGAFSVDAVIEEMLTRARSLKL